MSYRRKIRQARQHQRATQSLLAFQNSCEEVAAMAPHFAASLQRFANDIDKALNTLKGMRI